MGFPSLDCSFGGISAMAMRRDDLVIVDIFFKHFFEDCAALVIKEVVVRGIAGIL